MKELQAHAAVLGIDPTTPVGRLVTARRADAVLADLVSERDPRIIIEVLAAADLPAEPQAVARSITTARSLHQSLRGTDWQSIAASANLQDAHVDGVLAQLRATGVAEELHSPLQTAIHDAAPAARDALIRLVPVAPPVPAPAPTERVPVEERASTTGTTEATTVGPDVMPGMPVASVGIDDIQLNLSDPIDARLAAVATQIRESLTQNPGKRVHVKWWLE